MITTNINWAESIGRIFRRFMLWMNNGNRWDWFVNIIIIIILTSAIVVFMIWGITVNIQKEKIIEAETAVMIDNTAQLRNNRIKAIQKIEDKKKQIEDKKQIEEIIKEKITEEPLRKGIKTEVRKGMYKEAVERGYGEWIVIDTEGHTEFRWKMVKKEKEWKWFGWLR